MTRLTGICLAAALAVSAVVPAAHAQSDYPQRPITLVIGWSPGGAVDNLARQLAEQMGSELGQQIIVENRPGANGTIGHAQVAKATPDGYRILLATNSTYAIADHLYDQLVYSHQKDLVPVSLLTSSPLILAVSPNSGIKTLQDLIEAGKAKPGRLNMASGGVGSSSHLAGELFQEITGMQATHVAYKGGGPATTAVAAGEVDMAFLDLGVAVPFVNGNRIRALASSGEARASLLPEVPTFAEAGLPAFESRTYFALFAPTGTPQPIIDKLSAAATKALRQDPLKGRLEAQSIEIIASTPAELAERATAEHALWGRIIQERKLSLE
ncbi:tripartite tricarboxylate transporter substrate binding protein [Achromobacter sp. GG226]|uniref:Bug family tripartite tricarboxylate transporter substrate binding protein n=1 Tax=Verticiella alkaliphila TaxID=2779529 RepID=UPI001C0E71DB|nr:tripartite tricarboxylate transporter substrate binding protein [Verticiella sp. GG226]MBU4610614.1 tripartite tricarboxylate transporter substrate binding protein [Verticiella sp. GG226]